MIGTARTRTPSGRSEPAVFFGEVHMFRIQAPILIVPTSEARVALGAHLRPAALAAYREIALAAKGLEIAHLQFVFGKLTLAVLPRSAGRHRRDRDRSRRPTPAEEHLHRRVDASGGDRRPCMGR